MEAVALYMCYVRERVLSVCACVCFCVVQRAAFVGGVWKLWHCICVVCVNVC